MELYFVETKTHAYSAQMQDTATRAKKRSQTRSLSSPSFNPKKQETPSCLPFGASKGIREETLLHLKVVNLDFDARVPIPFSIFPSSYRNDAVETTTQTHVEGEINLPQGQQRVGREGQYSSSSFSASLPHRGSEEQFRQEEVHITREEDRYRPSRREEIHIHEERRPQHKHTTTHIDVELPRHHHHHEPQRRRYDSDITVDLPHHQRQQHETEVDFSERQYRSRFQPSYREETHAVGTTVDPPRFQSEFRQETRPTATTVDPPRFQATYREEARVNNSTVDPPRFQQPARREEVHIREETVDPPRHQFKKMGYYDEDGHYHSFRHGIHRAADRVLGRHHHHHHHHREPDREDVDITVVREGPAPSRSSGRSSAPDPASYTPNTVTIPCHHIRVGDLLILQGRPCQVIRVTTSAATGQHRYLGVDLFTKQLHEESSFISNPSPSVIVQTMLGPVFKQYRVLDLQDHSVVAMTETGDVKQAVPVIDQSNLWGRLKDSFDSGRGSLRALVLSDHGNELVVDMKVIHGSRL
ncbi:uncharacterized protein BP5553_01668 [Venustampulla echinocandica]|uniref:Translation initiation factor 5A-like N-terminal domain-containing protein n=1 Tax=Venustampulla echinocandica TaxID=2656787 RepID=A0A370U1M7_9HELO|nr:uncharacterized protein BP5553_01668 [Venustampulla echinocandica]RDL41689.1 hypothetical protein BP5553_01668 [Venustampulla echinocandica]